MGTCTDLIGVAPLNRRWAHRPWNAVNAAALPTDAEEAVRVLRSVSIDLTNPLQHWTESQIQGFENPANEDAYVMVHAKPFRYGYHDGESETDLDPTDFGDAEFDSYMAQELDYLEDLLALAITPKIFYLDCERFSKKDWSVGGAVAWNQAIRDHFEAYTNLIRGAFDDASAEQPHINYYGDSAWWPDASNIGWGQPNWIIPKGGPVSTALYGDSHGVVCYHMPEIDTTRIQILRARATNPAIPVFPWISLGWYKKRTAAAWHGESVLESIGVGAAYQWGAILNNPNYYGSSTTPADAPRAYRFGASDVTFGDFEEIGGCIYASPDDSLMIDDLLDFCDGSES